MFHFLHARFPLILLLSAVIIGYNYSRHSNSQNQSDQPNNQPSASAQQSTKCFSPTHKNISHAVPISAKTLYPKTRENLQHRAHARTRKHRRRDTFSAFAHLINRLGILRSRRFIHLGHRSGVSHQWHRRFTPSN